MSLLTDIDIRKSLGKNIVIEPFLEDSLTPVGYDFTVGDFVYSLQEGLLEVNNGEYTIPPRNTIQILTKEALWVSSRIAGSFHSKVSLVSKGFSHISTTLDPGWYGPLLITLSNNTDGDLKLKADAKFVTLLFYKVLTPTKTLHKKPPFRQDILMEQISTQMSEQTENYIKKIKSTLNTPQALKKFEDQVRQADAPLLAKVLSSVKITTRLQIGRVLADGLLIATILCAITLPLYWEKVKWLFGNIAYDSQVMGAQIALITLAVSVRQELKTRNS